MQLLDKLQKWFQIHCDGDWEHSYGVTIDTLDNPGWKISIDLNDTMLENIEFEAVCKGNSEDKNSFWIDCCKEDKTFVGMGSVDSLEKILAVFFEW
ncbi:MAG: rhodanese-related sulfurtransferase, partial [Ruminococcaceae bacterium]|nr:rhodanese-related sulfurtransferase [Oscillospiraceae bacterium]